MSTKNPHEDALEKEFQYYLEHEKELIKKHRGKVVVIKGHEKLGVYDNDSAAVKETMKAGHKLGTFLVQKCEPGASQQRFHSRVRF